MAWTLSLLLILVSITLVTYLHRGIQKLRKRAFVYPSEAIIDQTLPPELIELIALNTDYETLMACSLVSKYWHYHASKDHVQDHVFRNDTSLTFNIDDLKQAMSETGNQVFFPQQYRPLTYPPKYPAKYIIGDQYFAKRLGKKLIETSLMGARSIAQVMNGYQNYEEITKYVVKLRCKIRYAWTGYWSFEDLASVHSFSIDDTKVADCDKYEPTDGLECDVIVNLNSVWDSSGSYTAGIQKLRVLDPRPYIAGFPVSAILIQVMLLLIMPCLFVDYVNSTAYEVKFFAKALIALGFELFAIFLSINEHLPRIDGTEQVTKKRKIGILSGLGTLVVGLVFYRWSLELALYVATIGGCAVYYLIWETFVWKKYSSAKIVGFIVLCLVVLMNDWKLTVDAFKSGEIIWTIAYNTLMHLQLGVLFTLHNALTEYFNSRVKTTYKEYLLWRREYKEMFLFGLIPLVFITLYGPTTTYKLFV